MKLYKCTFDIPMHCMMNSVSLDSMLFLIELCYRKRFLEHLCVNLGYFESEYLLNSIILGLHGIVSYTTVVMGARPVSNHCITYPLALNNASVKTFRSIES